MKKLFFILILAVIAGMTGLMAQSIEGVWKTIDDETGKEKSQVQIFIKNGKAYGKIIKLYRSPREEQDPICDVCPGDRKNKKIIGMQIIDGLQKDGEEWEADEAILDPKTGKIYDCKIWLEGADILKVRGYIGFLFRTQTWYRIK